MKSLFKIGRQSWNINNFSHWLITGGTGMGKTSAAISSMLYSLLKKEDHLGAFILDQKGNFHKIVESMVGAFYQKERNRLVKKFKKKLLKESNINVEELENLLNEDNERKLLRQSYDYLCQNEAINIPFETYYAERKNDILKKFEELQSTKNSGFFNKYKDRLAIIKVRSSNEDPPPYWKLNILQSDMPSETIAKFVVDAALSIQYGTNTSQNDFFRTQGATHIEEFVNLLRLIVKVINLREFKDSIEPAISDMDRERFRDYINNNITLYNLTSISDMDELNIYLDFAKIIARDDISKTLKLESDDKEALKTAIRNFEKSFAEQATEQLSGVKGTLNNILKYFNNKFVREVFCSESNVHIEDVDKGKIIVCTVPPEMPSSRDYIGTLMKYYMFQHTLNRLKTPFSDLNFVIMLFDEGHELVSHSERSYSDSSIASRAREAKVSMIYSVQDMKSFLVNLRPEVADALMLNLQNRIHYQVAEEETAKLLSEFLGKRKKTEKSETVRGFLGEERSWTYRKTDVPKYPPEQLRNLRPFEAIVCAANIDKDKVYTPPILPDGRRPGYWFKVRIKYFLQDAIRLLTRPYG